MALLACLAPQELLRLNGSLINPLGWSQGARDGQRRLAGQVPIWLSDHTQLARMRPDVIQELSYDKPVNLGGLFAMWHTFLKAFIKLKEVAARASFFIAHGSH